MSRPDRLVRAMHLLLLCGAGAVAACGNDSAAPPAPVASVEVTAAAPGVVIGHTLQLTGHVRDEAGHELADRPVTWTSNAPTQATVSSTGLVTGLALSDSVLITASSEGKSDGATLTVVPAIAGEWNYTEQFSGTHNGRPVTCSDTGSYQFTQTGPAIEGTVIQVGTCNGPITSLNNASIWSDPVADGQLSSTRLTFNAQGCTYAADVTGPPAPKLSGTLSCGDWTGTWDAVPGGGPVASVSVRSDVQTVVGGVVQLVAVPQDVAGHVLSRGVSWSSDNPSVAAVSEGGLVSALASGSARITATSEGQIGSAAVTAELVSFAAVSAGFFHSCAVTTTGAAYCWGWGGDGQLGTGFRPPARAPSASSQTPVAVTGGHSFAMVATSFGRSCGVTTSGEALCWGENSSGQLGDGSQTSSLVPVPVTGGQQFSSVTLGAYHACGVTTTNAAYCWGVNSEGQLGNGSQTFSPSPVLVAGNLVFQSVRAGSFHTCGVTISQLAYCWGYNLAGQLGDGTSAFAVATPVAVTGDHSFAAVAAGYAHSCAMTPQGAAYCWGSATLLGDGSGQDQLIPVPVAGGLSFSTAGGAISAGQESSCALTPAGAADCWGHNDLGEIGDASTIARATPAPVSGGLTFTTISVGLFHTCGVTSTAVAFCWGNNGSGQLGAATAQTCVLNGMTAACATSPVRVTGTVQAGASVARAAGRDAHVQERNPSILLQRLGPDVLNPASIVRAPRQ